MVGCSRSAPLPERTWTELSQLAPSERDSGCCYPSMEQNQGSHPDSATPVYSRARESSHRLLVVPTGSVSSLLELGSLSLYVENQR